MIEYMWENGNVFLEIKRYIYNIFVLFLGFLFLDMVLSFMCDRILISSSSNNSS